MAMDQIGTVGSLSSGNRALSARIRAVLAGGAAATILIAALGPADAALTRKYPAAKREQAKKEPPAKPLHVPIIAISIASQRLTVYDNGVPVAQAPVSTGMAGHLTPTGIFSVIQKEVFHRSNIYSGAPMPYMQRVTWSGIAMHAGVLPGYPASHGCIRMPAEFAVKLYALTRPGARVLIARNEVVPAPFEHARLFVLPKPVSTSQLDEAPAAADSKPAVRTAAPADAPKPAALKPAETAVAEPPSASATATEAPKDAAQEATKEVATEAAQDAAKEPAKDAVTEVIKEAPAETAQEATKEATTENIDAAAPVNPVATADAPKAAPQDAAKDGAKTAAKDTDATTGTVMVKPIPVVPAQPVEVQKAFETATTPPKVDSKPETATKTESTKTESTKAESKPEPKPEPATQITLEPYGPERPLRPGPITVFVSKKEGKVFVRKAFQPVFSWPVTFARPELPLGTHIFTATDAKADGEGFHWLAVSMPAEPQKKVEVRVTKDKKGRRIETKVETLGPAQSATAAEALERVDIPAPIIARISRLMSPGASLIISDQGLGGETGIETDFIVLTR
jgi:hypothetical protein